MAGAYSASVLRAAEKVLGELEEQGKTAELYVAGRRGDSYFRFRGREVAQTWLGGSDAPTVERADDIAETLLERFHAEDGVGELHVVYTRFVSMVTQVPEVRRMLPLAIVAAEEADVDSAAEAEASPLYTFEPSAEEVLDTLLPMYVRRRIHAQLLMASASELAARQQAMRTATDNAEDLIREYTRLKNSARQADITTEISEIVSGADALAAS